VSMASGSHHHITKGSGFGNCDAAVSKMAIMSPAQTRVRVEGGGGGGGLTLYLERGVLCRWPAHVLIQACGCRRGKRQHRHIRGHQGCVATVINSSGPFQAHSVVFRCVLTVVFLELWSSYILGGFITLEIWGLAAIKTTHMSLGLRRLRDYKSVFLALMWRCLASSFFTPTGHEHRP
jgi:hypothetical protein